MKINYAFASRALIALLFVVAGAQKLMDFTGTVSIVEGLGVPFPMLATILVILVEVPVALAFAFGYKVRMTGWLLVGFTVLTTLLVHRDFSNQLHMLMTLKNIAIIGGIMSVIGCCCNACVVHDEKK